MNSFIKILSKIFNNDSATKNNVTVGSSKTIINANETLEINTKTKQTIELVKKNVTDIMKSCNNNPEKYLELIQAKGTEIVRMHNAKKILNIIREDEGFIAPLKGFKAIYINFVIFHKVSFTTEPLFIASIGTLEPYYMLREFYKWYSYDMGLGGFNFEAQENFKKYLRNINSPDFKKLNYKSMVELKEAIARDAEANEFVIEFAKQKDGSANVFKKINNGSSANI